ncbi:jg366 [Pararge aegeria aegeria]|uniref:Jg366 protein n=1 Tax=Pararge aegeria aegeria TaxID=348720 RepID=A0A8S4QW66_9NEOP|nr:jg366 [Pararge aegeria aegeria]
MGIKRLYEPFKKISPIYEEESSSDTSSSESSLSNSVSYAWSSESDYEDFIKLVDNWNMCGCLARINSLEYECICPAICRRPPTPRPTSTLFYEGKQGYKKEGLRSLQRHIPTAD